ncbi:MAG: dihydrodipicolinate synthase family protein [Candidatus Onthomonas sp.]
MKASYITPAVTVFYPDGSINLDETGKVYEHLIQGQVDGILLLGSIGEFFAPTLDQKKELIRFALRRINHRVPVLVGTTSMVFDEIIQLSRFAGEEGADGVIILPPYYFPLSEASIEEYYGRIAELLPEQSIYLYNFPDRTGYDVTPQVTLHLVEKYANIKGYKDTQAGMDHTRELIKRIKPVRPDFEIYSGFDDNFAHNVLSGGDGCIAGLSNLVPELTHGWAEALRRTDLSAAQAAQRKIDLLMEIYQVGRPFVPYIKAAMEERGIISNASSSFPFPQVTDGDREKIRGILAKAGF